MTYTGRSFAVASPDVILEQGTLFEDLEDLACQLGVSLDALHHWRRQKDKYVHPKKRTVSGKERQFYVPRGEFKALLTKLDKLLKGYELPKYFYGSPKRVSAIDSALVHVSNPLILKMDLSSFFPSSSFRRMRRALSVLSPDPEVARFITSLCSYEYQLPQGFPTSPSIAEIVLIPIGRRLAGLCATYGLELSVYIDDITISGSEILASLRDRILEIFKEMRFRLNYDKTKLARSDDGVVVTGILLKNRRATTKPAFDEEVATLRWLRDYMEASGESSAALDIFRRLKNKLQWMLQVDPEKHRKILTTIQQARCLE